MGQASGMETDTVELAYAKLTRSLRIDGVRDDGYHLLSSEMVTVDLADRLEFATGRGLVIRDNVPWVAREETRSAGFAVPADESNLVMRALSLAGVDRAVTLTKHIPSGAGLGGGSADAAAVLRHVGYSDAKGASALGADVPFCVFGGRALVTGIGEVIKPLPYLELAFVILTPPFGIATAAVYQMFDVIGKTRDPTCQNDLLAPALLVEPRLSIWYDLLGEITGIEPVLAGSGSSLFVECAPEHQLDIAAAVIERVNERGEQALVTPAISVPSLGG